MTTTYTGGCACGAIRYETSNAPVFENHCQCRDCQMRSGTGHASYLTFMQRSEIALTGKATTWRVVAENGREKLHAFCPTCGTPVYLTFPDVPDQLSIHATTLDDPDQFRPQAVTYAIRGHAWDMMDPALQRFEKMPPR